MRLNTFSKAGKLRKSFSLVLISIILVTCIGGAVFSVPLNVFALPPALLKARTIGELIITILAGANTAVVAPPIVGPIYSNYTTESNMDYESLINNGILSIDGESAETAIESLGSGRAYNLDTDAFRNLVSSNWQSMRDIGIDTVLRVGDMANTDSVYGAIDNLGQIIKNVAEYGYLGYENSIAVIANPGTVVKVTLENIKDAFLERFGTNINNGIPITTKLPDGVYGFVAGGSWNLEYTMYGDLEFVGRWGSTDHTSIYIDGINFNNNIEKINIANSWNQFESYNVASNGGKYSYGSSLKANTVYGLRHIFNDTNEESAYIQGVLNGTTQRYPYNPVAPDVINTQQGNIDNTNDVEPAITPDQGLEIIPQSEYEPMIEDADNNTENGDYEDNAPVINNIITNNIYQAPAPTQPPVIPDQPDINPKPSVAPETSDEIMNNRLPGLETKFPFCIPWDFRNALKVFEEEKRAPKIIWNLKIERFGIDETLEIDFAIFDPVARILRTLLLITYIIGLILATRQLIRG